MAKASTTRSRSTKKSSAPSKSPAPDDTDVAIFDADEEAPAESEDNNQNVSTLDAETHAKYERVKRGELHIKDLQQMIVAELHEVAKKEGLTEYTGLKKQDLIFKILKQRIQQDGLMYGEGVLEILPDGFGFLRSPEYNYLPDSRFRSSDVTANFGITRPCTNGTA